VTYEWLEELHVYGVVPRITEKRRCDLGRYIYDMFFMVHLSLKNRMTSEVSERCLEKLALHFKRDQYLVLYERCHIK